MALERRLIDSPIGWRPRPNDGRRGRWSGRAWRPSPAACQTRRRRAISVEFRRRPVIPGRSRDVLLTSGLRPLAAWTHSHSSSGSERNGRPQTRSEHGPSPSTGAQSRGGLRSAARADRGSSRLRLPAAMPFAIAGILVVSSVAFGATIRSEPRSWRRPTPLPWSSATSRTRRRRRRRRRRRPDPHADPDSRSPPVEPVTGGLALTADVIARQGEAHLDRVRGRRLRLLQGRPLDRRDGQLAARRRATPSSPRSTRSTR